MRLSSINVIILVALVNAFLWYSDNRPIEPGALDSPIQSLSLNPYGRDQSPYANDIPSDESLEKDFSVLSERTLSVRIYTTGAGMDRIPAIARKHDIKVVASAWLDERTSQNEHEVEATIRLAGLNRNVNRVLIGNETQLIKSVPFQELVEYLQKARKRLRTPVSTAEPWDYWLNHPELVREVDYIAIHVLPYWNEVPVEQAVDYVIDRYNAVKSAYPYKAVIIGETGWPSDGPQKGAAVANQANQALFTREFVRRAEAVGITYNIIEAFNQPWKSIKEGRAGEHWGLMNADRGDKFPLKGPVLNDPNWTTWTLSAAGIGILLMGVFLVRRNDLRLTGRLFSATVIQAASTLACLLAREAADQYMSPGDIVFWSVMLTAQAVLAIIFLTDAVEIADVVGNRPLRRRFPAQPQPGGDELPMVSIHLACCREPAELVMATLDSLSRLDYPNFEVIVVDNNTPDEASWLPIKEHCKSLGDRFRFYSLGRWPGFKAGALNYALAKTDPRAAIVGVVDADYVVESRWLSVAIPYFTGDPNVALVQAPQEHRAWEDSLFQQMENDEYSGFFRIGMVQRNEHNAIIQHGTMTLIDRASLDEVNGWAEWCICEDAELGLRLLLRGRKSVYINEPLGRGLVPDSFAAYAKQRFRWAYGGMRIMRRYWPHLLGLKGSLTFKQRYHFVKGWLPWLGDALHLLFTTTAIGWSIKLIVDPLQTEFPEPIFVYPALALVALRIFGTAWTYEYRVKIGTRRTALAMIAGSSLTHTIGKAVAQGLFFRGKPFHRTPKLASAPALVRSLGAAAEELVLCLSLIGLAFGVWEVFGTFNHEAVVWMAALLTQAIPYLASVLAALASGLGKRVKPEPVPVPQEA